MWQSIPRTGSLLLRASRPHSIQRFPAACSPPSMPRSLLPAVSRCLLSSLHASLPASSGFLPPPLLPPCCSPCVQRFTRCPSLPRPRVTTTKAQQNLLTT